MLAALVVRASGESGAYLSWVTFISLVVTGASMILQTLRLRYLGSGRLIANFNVPFLAVSALALHVGGPRLPARLVVASTLVQFVLTLHPEVEIELSRRPVLKDHAGPGFERVLSNRRVSCNIPSQLGVYPRGYGGSTAIVTATTGRVRLSGLWLGQCRENQGASNPVC